MKTPYLSEAAYRKMLANFGWPQEKIDDAVAMHKESGRCPQNLDDKQTVGEVTSLWQESSRRLGFK